MALVGAVHGVVFSGAWLGYIDAYYRVTRNSRVFDVGGILAAGTVIFAATFGLPCLQRWVQQKVYQLAAHRVTSFAQRGHAEAVCAYLTAAGLGSARSQPPAHAQVQAQVQALASDRPSALASAGSCSRLEIVAVSAVHAWLDMAPIRLLGWALVMACANDHADLVSALLAEGAPFVRVRPNTVYASRIAFLDMRGWKILHVAAAEGSVAAIQVLLRAGATVDGSAVAYALRRGQWGAANMLLDAKADVAASDISISDSPLALACRFPEAATNGMVERLLHCKVDVDSPCRFASTDRPLSAAVGAPVVSMATVQALVQAKAAIDGAVRFPPLIKAVARGHVEVVRYLCAAKADVHFSTYNSVVHLLARPSHSLRQFWLPPVLFFFDYVVDPAVAASDHRARMQVLELPHDEGLTTDGLMNREYCCNRQECVRVLLRAKAVLSMGRVIEIAGELMHNAAQHVAFNGN